MPSTLDSFCDSWDFGVESDASARDTWVMSGKACPQIESESLPSARAGQRPRRAAWPLRLLCIWRSRLRRPSRRWCRFGGGCAFGLVARLSGRPYLRRTEQPELFGGAVVGRLDGISGLSTDGASTEGLSRVRTRTRPPVQRPALDPSWLLPCLPVQRRALAPSWLLPCLPVQRRALAPSWLLPCLPVQRRALAQPVQLAQLRAQACSRLLTLALPEVWSVRRLEFGGGHRPTVASTGGLGSLAAAGTALGSADPARLLRTRRSVGARACPSFRRP